MKFKAVIREVILLIALLAATILAFWFHKIQSSGNADIDRTVHVIMFGLNLKLFLLPVWMVLVILSYGIKEAIFGYKRRFQNIILLTAIVLAECYLMLITTLVSVFFDDSGGATIYPPLSALPLTFHKQPHSGIFIFHYNWQVLYSTQIFFLLLLVIIAILTGKNWNIKQRES